MSRTALVLSAVALPVVVLAAAVLAPGVWVKSAGAGIGRPPLTQTQSWRWWIRPGCRTPNWWPCKSGSRPAGG